MTCTNMHKANLGSQLSIYYTGSFARARPRPNELIRAHSLGGALTRMTCPNELTQTPPNNQPERFYMGTRTTETKRTCTKPTSGHNLEFFI